MIRLRGYPCPILLLGFVLACDSGAHSGSEPSSESGQLPHRTVDTLTVLGDESLGDGHAFGHIVGAVLLGDAETAVADQMANEISIFSAGGSAVGTLGGTGEGPGEFQSLRAVARHGPSSLVAHDVAPQRVTLLRRDDGTVRPITLEFPFERVNSSRFLGSLGDSLLAFEVVFVADSRMPADGVAGFSKAVALFGPDGDFRAEVVRLRGRQMLRGRCTIQGRAMNCSSEFPFNTAEVPVLLRDHLAVLDPLQATVQLFGLDGSRVGSWSPGRAADSLDTESSQTIWENHLQGRPREMRSALLDIAGSVPLFKPHWNGLLKSGPSEVLLVRRGESGLEGVAFSQTGIPSYRILVGGGVTVLDVSIDRILVLTQDEFDVERVVVLRGTATPGG